MNIAETLKTYRDKEFELKAAVCAKIVEFADNPEIVAWIKRISSGVSQKMIRQHMRFAQPHHFQIGRDDLVNFDFGRSGRQRFSFEVAAFETPEAFIAALEAEYNDRVTHESKESFYKYNTLRKRWENPKGYDRVTAGLQRQ